METNIPADRPVEAFTAGAAGVLAVSAGGPTGAEGAAATGGLTGSAGAAAEAGVTAGFGGRAERRVG